MQGRIKNYNKERGFGFIQATDGNDYFFHISNYKEPKEPEVNETVSFETIESDKGLQSINVKKILDTKPIFISFGDVRIKTSNIKNYGIDFNIHTYIKYEKTWEDFKGEWKEENERIKKAIQTTRSKIRKWSLQKTLDRRHDKNMEYNYELYKEKFRNNLENMNPSKNPESRYTFSEYLDKKWKFKGSSRSFYLYVTTFQGDNYKFRESNQDFDIHEKVKEMDSYFT